MARVAERQWYAGLNKPGSVAGSRYRGLSRAVIRAKRIGADHWGWDFFLSRKVVKDFGRVSAQARQAEKAFVFNAQFLSGPRSLILRLESYSSAYCIAWS